MVLTYEQVAADLLQWIRDFVEVPHPALGRFPPCPYARKARLENDFEVRIGTDPMSDMIELAEKGIAKSIVAIAYDPKLYPHSVFSEILNRANLDYLLSKNLLVLKDHPEHPDIINGVCLNQGTYALALVQELSDLNEKAAMVAKKGFYHPWPEEYLQALFKHRIDPRTV